MLKILDETQIEFGSVTSNIYSGKLRFSGNGKIGFSSDKLLYVTNDDPTKYYTNITVSPISSTYDDIMGEWGETGFGVKLILGERRPTEIEWDQIGPGDSIVIPDIGDTTSADIENLIPIWVRLIVPGLTKAQLKTNISLRLTRQEKNLGT